MKRKYVLLILLFFVAACGGGGDGGGSDFFDVVPNESVNPAWNATWSWRLYVSESNCPGVTKGNTTTSTSTIKIPSSENCEELLNVDVNLPENIEIEEFQCEMGGNVLAAHWEAKMTHPEISDCTLSGTIDELLELDADGGRILGSITGKYSLSLGCPVEPGTPRNCEATITVTGIYTASTSSAEFLTKRIPVMNMFEMGKTWNLTE